MKTKLFIIFTQVSLLFLSCDGTETVGDGETSQNIDSIINNLGKDKTPPNFKYYGIDYEGDTVIYENKGKILTEGYITGNFVEIQKSGRYSNLILKDSLGLYHKFLVWFDNKELSALYSYGKRPRINEKIKVKWRREKENLALWANETGSDTIVYKMVDIETELTK